MPVSTDLVQARTYDVRLVAAKLVAVDNYKNSGPGSGPDGIFMYYEDLLNRITNKRLPLHLGV